MDYELTGYLREATDKLKTDEIIKEKRMIQELVAELKRQGMVVPTTLLTRTRGDVVQDLGHITRSQTRYIYAYLLSRRDHNLIDNTLSFCGRPVYVRPNPGSEMPPKALILARVSDCKPERTKDDVLRDLHKTSCTKGRRASGYAISHMDNDLLGGDVRMFAGLPLYVRASYSNTNRA